MIIITTFPCLPHVLIRMVGWLVAVYSKCDVHSSIYRYIFSRAVLHLGFFYAVAAAFLFDVLTLPTEHLV